MLSSTEIKTALSDRNIRKVAQAIGVHENSLYKFMRGESDPRVSLIEKLDAYLSKGVTHEPTE